MPQSDVQYQPSWYQQDEDGKGHDREGLLLGEHHLEGVGPRHRETDRSGRARVTLLDLVDGVFLPFPESVMRPFR